MLSITRFYIKKSQKKKCELFFYNRMFFSWVWSGSHHTWRVVMSTKEPNTMIRNKAYHQIIREFCGKTTQQFGANIKFHVRIIVIVTIIITIALFASQQIKKKLAFIFYGFWRSQLCVFIEIAKWYSEYLHLYLSFIIICDAFRLKWR